MGLPSLARASGSKILVAAKRACTNRPNLPVSRRRSQVAAGPPTERRGGMAVARWLMGVALAAVLVAVPFIHFRAEYAHHKRLRVVAPGILYRSGQMTADGFRDAVARFGFRTIINCQNEFPDPALTVSFWDRRTICESDLCRELGVWYVHLDPDLCPERTNSA